MEHGTIWYLFLGHVSSGNCGSPRGDETATFIKTTWNCQKYQKTEDHQNTDTKGQVLVFCMFLSHFWGSCSAFWNPLETSKAGGLAATGPLVSRATPSPYGSAAQTLGTVPLTASECGSAQRRRNTDVDFSLGFHPEKWGS